ncbi:MAG: hypothetical protein HYT80_09165 [Euryarchaeota archaeon]|nr:hypothetical protein [Euryarchaeota archaeon]
MSRTSVALVGLFATLISLCTTPPESTLDTMYPRWVDFIVDARDDVMEVSDNGSRPAAAPYIDIIMVRLQERQDRLRIQVRAATGPPGESQNQTSLLSFTMFDSTNRSEARVELYSSDADLFQVVVDGIATEGGPVTFQGFPSNYDAEVGRNLLQPDGTWGPGDGVRGAVFTSRDEVGPSRVYEDRAPDEGRSGDFVFGLEAGFPENRDEKAEPAETSSVGLWTSLLAIAFSMATMFGRSS